MANWAKLSWELLFGERINKELISYFILLMITDVLEIINLITTKYIIEWIQGLLSTTTGIIFVSTFILSLLIGFILRNYKFMYSFVIFTKINKGISALLFQKVWKLSQKSLSVVNSGKLISIVSGELQTIEETLQNMPFVISKPIMLLLIFGYLWIEFEEASALSLVSLILILAIFMMMVSRAANWKYLEGNLIWSLSIGTYSDIRIKFISDIVNGIKTIKAFCWEEIFKSKIDEVRNKQLSFILKSRLIYTVVILFVINGGFLVTIVLFGYQWGMGRQISYSSAFVALLFAGHISYRNLLLFFQGLFTLVSFLTIWSRADEIINMDEHINENKSIGGNDEIHKTVTKVCSFLYSSASLG